VSDSASSSNSGSDSSSDSDSGSSSGSDSSSDGGSGSGEAGQTATGKKRKRSSGSSAAAASGGGGSSSSAGGKSGKGGKGGLFAREMVLSAPLAEFFGCERMARGEANRRMWAYVKEAGLQRNARGHVVCDAKLSAALGGRKTLNFSVVAKALAAGLKDPSQLVGGGGGGGGAADDDEEEEEEEEDGEGEAGDGGGAAASGSSSGRGRGAGGSGGSRKASAKAKKAPPAKRSRKATAGDGGEDGGAGAGAGGGGGGGGGGSGGFNKPIPLSAALGAFMGTPTASRTAVTKALWAHIKERGLQNPADKRMIRVTGTALAPVFPGHAEVHMFSMVRARGKGSVGCP
jgi:chromatin remodeling complex protein RSC6